MLRKLVQQTRMRSMKLPATEEPAPPLEPRCIISLRAENVEPMNMKIRPWTPIGKLMAGYHKQMNIEEGKTCWLVMDGEKLEPHLKIQDTDIEDGDVVEVIIK